MITRDIQLIFLTVRPSVRPLREDTKAVGTSEWEDERAGGRADGRTCERAGGRAGGLAGGLLVKREGNMCHSDLTAIWREYGGVVCRPLI